MKRPVAAVLSLLHQSAADHSGTRSFRHCPVIDWTLRRLQNCSQLHSLAILCWEDQMEILAPIAAARGAYMLAKGPRMALPSVQSIAAAQRWSDGWRGGLQRCCALDQGFYGPWVLELVEKLQAQAAVLVDPAAALIDPALVDQLALKTDSTPAVPMAFIHAPPGLTAGLLELDLLKQLAGAKSYPGRLLNYLPDQPMRDPLAGPMCVEPPMRVANSTCDLRMDSQRHIKQLGQALHPLNGQLITTAAQPIVELLESADWPRPMRELVLEINCRRDTRPVFFPQVDRADMSPATAQAIFQQLARIDDLRLTLAGAGDPLLSEHFFSIALQARQCGIKAIHVQTDLLNVPAQVLEQLVKLQVDVISINMPALSAGMYRALMGVDGLGRVVENIRLLCQLRAAADSGVPLIVPTFVKCRQNLGEMEGWYDQWLRALGSAVICAPSDFGGLVEPMGVADMAPAGRVPCRTLAQRMIILSDGAVVACQRDLAGKFPLGRVPQDPLDALWDGPLRQWRHSHQQGHYAAGGACAACKEWHQL